MNPPSNPRQNNNSRPNNPFVELIKRFKSELKPVMLESIQNRHSELMSERENLLQQINLDLETNINNGEHEQTAIEQFEIYCEAFLSSNSRIPRDTAIISLGHIIARHNPRYLLQIQGSHLLQNYQNINLIGEAFTQTALTGNHELAVDFLEQNTLQNLVLTDEQTIFLAESLRTQNNLINFNIEERLGINCTRFIEILPAESLIALPIKLCFRQQNQQKISEKIQNYLENLSETDLLIKRLIDLKNINPDIYERIHPGIIRSREDKILAGIRTILQYDSFHITAQELYSLVEDIDDGSEKTLEIYLDLIEKNQTIHKDLFNDMIKIFFEESNQVTSEWMFTNIQTIKNNEEILERTLENCKLESISQAEALRSIRVQELPFLIKILLNTYEHNKNHLFKEQAQSLILRLAKEPTPNQQEELAFLEIFKLCPKLGSNSKAESKKLLKRFFYLIPLHITELGIEKFVHFRKPIFEILSSKESLELPHTNNIDKLPTNYFHQSIKKIDQFKTKTHLESENLTKVIEYLKEIQKVKNPSFDFNPYNDDIRKINI